MRLPRKRFVIALTILLAMLGVMAILVVQVDRRAGERYFRDLKRDARGPWPKERVEQAVIVRCPTGSGDVSAIEGPLRDVLQKTNLGYFDGAECLDARCSLFFYGPDAKKLLETVRPILKASIATSQASVLLRLGRGDSSSGVLQEARW
jgi:hypothetical protein